MAKPLEFEEPEDHNEPVYHICAGCVVPSLLKELISASELHGDCSFCKANSTAVAESSAPTFVKAVKSVLRYHFSEWDYHSKLGGDDFDSLLLRNLKLFFHIGSDLAEIDLEDFISSITCKLDSEKDISLFSAYGRDIYSTGKVLLPVAVGKHPLIEKIERDLVDMNHFLVAEDAMAEFARLKPYVSSEVKQADGYFRSRVGAVKKAFSLELPSMQRSDYYAAFEGADIGAPPIRFSAAGRLNRPGVSFLYLASEVETAIAEIRPHPGQFVSLGTFEAVRDFKIADFTNHSLSQLHSNNDELELLRLIVSSENTLATMAPPTDQSIYSTTQLISDVLRQLGFEGIKFRSTVGSGVNLTLFDATLMKWVDKSGAVFEVEKVKYEWDKKAMYDPTKPLDYDFLY